MKQTAVEWLVQNIKEKGLVAVLWNEKVIEQAKDMEKEQLKQLMWDLTEIDMTKNKGMIIDNRFDTYWNETFKSE